MKTPILTVSRGQGARAGWKAISYQGHPTTASAGVDQMAGTIRAGAFYPHHPGHF